MQSAPAGENQPDQSLLERSIQIDEFEGYSRPHAARIAAISEALASQFNLASHDRSFLKKAAYLHDVGEFVMGRDYIAESRILAAEEILDMHRHPVIGEQEVARLGLPRGIQLLVRWHHEWWDGSGYPDGLEGEQIPLAARVLRIADTYASITGARPFRNSVPADEARKFLTDWAGIEFDPKVVKGLLSLDLSELNNAFSLKIE